MISGDGVPAFAPQIGGANAGIGLHLLLRRGAGALGRRQGLIALRAFLNGQFAIALGAPGVGLPGFPGSKRARGNAVAIPDRPAVFAARLVALNSIAAQYPVEGGQVVGIVRGQAGVAQGVQGGAD
jgi:hypothetical protein